MKILLRTLRTVKNYRAYTLVAIAGLALSFACVITISRYIYAELTTDTFHSKIDRIGAILQINQDGNPPFIGDVWESYNGINNDIDIALYSSNFYLHKPVVEVNKRLHTPVVLAIDSNFQRLFDFPIIAGDTLLCRTIGDVAITQRLAKKLFGDENPIGKRVKLDGREATINTIIGEPNVKSTINFDMLSHSTTVGGNGMPSGFVLIKDNACFDKINQRNDTIITDKYSSQKNQLLPMKEVYMSGLHETSDNVRANQGNPQTLRILFIIAILVLGVGVINFVNIYTVLMIRRTREMSIKTIFGAAQTRISTEIYLENLTMVALAIAIGWFLSLSAQDFVTAHLNMSIKNSPLFNTAFTLSLLLLLPLLTSIYPYIKHRLSKTLTSLKEVNSSKRAIKTRATFLVLQYIITIFLVSTSIYFAQQLNFMLNTPLGFNTENIIKTKLFSNLAFYNNHTATNDEDFRKKRNKQYDNSDLFTNYIQTVPFIEAWSSGNSPNNYFNNWYQTMSANEITCKEVVYARASESDLKMYDLKLKDGRWWNNSIDKWAGYNMIVNEAFLREFNITDWRNTMVQPERRLWWSDGDMSLNPPYAIIGVVEDFQVQSLKGKKQPLMIHFNGGNSPVGREISLRYTAGKEQETIQMLDSLHKIYSNDAEFSYTFLRDEIAAQYDEEKRIVFTYSIFAFIAIIIGALGLLSLTLFDIRQRYREIALRRVNGATVKGIINMMLRKYYILLLISFALSIPITILAINYYMQDYAHRAPLSWWIFALALILTSAISLLTILYQIHKAASQNPALAMKQE